MNKKFMGDSGPQSKDAATMAVIHIAGEYKDGMQKCERCGETILDNRNVMAPVGSKAHFFTPHERVTKKGNSVYAGLIREPSAECAASKTLAE